MENNLTRYLHLYSNFKYVFMSELCLLEGEDHETCEDENGSKDDEDTVTGSPPASIIKHLRRLDKAVGHKREDIRFPVSGHISNIPRHKMAVLHKCFEELIFRFHIHVLMCAFRLTNGILKIPWHENVTF